MTALPAPLLRGLSVLALGTVLALGHIAFAAAAPKGPVPAAAATDIDATGSIATGEALGENCYVEIVRERDVRGKTVARRVHECD